MGLLIPTFANPILLAREQAAEEMAWAQADYIDRKTRMSERGENPPETIDSTDLLATSMNWDYADGWEDRRLAYVKELRARRKPFRPSVRVRMPDGFVQGVYEGDQVDLQWFERGLCCVRCCQWKHEDHFQHVREHKRLQDATGAEPPQGVALKDLCAFCGNRLDLQKFRREAA